MQEIATAGHIVTRTRSARCTKPRLAFTSGAERVRLAARRRCLQRGGLCGLPSPYWTLATRTQPNPGHPDNTIYTYTWV